MEDKVALSYSIFNTSFGLCGIVCSKKGVVRFILPGMVKSELKKEIAYLKLKAQSSKLEGRNRSLDLLARGKRQDEIEYAIKRYFDGERIDFNFPLDLSYSTTFQKKVFKITKTIPYGEVKTYNWVAKKIGLPHASRAIGGALSRNPIPLLIPCHRVVREDGKMGGFTAPGGVDLKMKMIELESKSLKV